MPGPGVSVEVEFYRSALENLECLGDDGGRTDRQTSCPFGTIHAVKAGKDFQASLDLKGLARNPSKRIQAYNKGMEWGLLPSARQYVLTKIFAKLQVCHIKLPLI